MKKAKLFMIFLILLLVLTPFSMVSAAPSSDVADSLSGTVIKIEVLTPPASGASTIWVTILDEQGQEQTVQVSLETALEWHLVVYENDVLVPNEAILNTEIDIPLDSVIPDETDEILHPVASALATFFSDIPGVDYDFIMSAHEDGLGFGVIAQALWLTMKLEGDSEVLEAILEARETGDFSSFSFEDGSTPANWGQFRKAVMDGDKKGNLGVVMSGREKDKDNGGTDHGNNGNNGDNGNNGNNGNEGNDGNDGNNGNDGNHGNSDGPQNTNANGNKGNHTNNGNKDKP